MADVYIGVSVYYASIYKLRSLCQILTLGYAEEVK